jgi:pyruvate/2-oxoglutarate dehydrogenase complex dihydrolipoamide acyltransferase (E2) component
MTDLDFRLPKLGMSIVEATISEWLVEEGAVVEEGQPLVVVEMDKAESDLPSPIAGTIVKIVPRAGDLDDNE